MFLEHKTSTTRRVSHTADQSRHIPASMRAATCGATEPSNNQYSDLGACNIIATVRYPWFLYTIQALMIFQRVRQIYYAHPFPQYHKIVLSSEREGKHDAWRSSGSPSQLTVLELVLLWAKSAPHTSSSGSNQKIHSHGIKPKKTHSHERSIDRLQSPTHASQSQKDPTIC